MAVHAEDVRGAGAAHRRLEPRVRRDDVVGQHAPVAAAADAEPSRIGDTKLYDVIHRGEYVLHVLVAPVRVYGAREVKAAPGPAARIRGHDRVALRRIGLPVGHELVAELVHGAAVQPQDRRIALARLVIERLDAESPSIDVPSALLNSIGSTGARRFPLRNALWLVSARSPRLLDRGELVRMPVVTTEDGDPSVPGDRYVGVETPTGGERRDLAAGHINA